MNLLDMRDDQKGDILGSCREIGFGPGVTFYPSLAIQVVISFVSRFPTDLLEPNAVIRACRDTPIPEPMSMVAVRGFKLYLKPKPSIGQGNESQRRILAIQQNTQTQLTQKMRRQQQSTQAGSSLQLDRLSISGGSVVGSGVVLPPSAVQRKTFQEAKKPESFQNPRSQNPLDPSYHRPLLLNSKVGSARRRVTQSRLAFP
jgi:hypothetical protein